MASGYTRVYSKSTGNTILASDFNTEFQLIDDAFDDSTGHKHDGSTNEGALVPLISDPDNHNAVEVDASNNEIDFFVEVGAAKVQQVKIADGVIEPETDNDVDLGSALKEFKDLYLDGVAYIDTANVDSLVTTAGTIDGENIVGEGTTQTLTGKTISTTSNTITVAEADINDLGTTILLHADVDDTPVNGATTVPASSNWAYDHENATAAHGVSGDVVGTSDNQTLTQKTIVAADNTITTAASGNLTSTELNAALAELQTDIDNVGYVDKTYIFGLTYEWVSPTQIKIHKGGCFVEGKHLTLSADSTETPSITGSALDVWYIYAYDNSGIDFEFSTTEPEWSDTYRYWQKTSDSSRRCIGKFWSDTSNNIIETSSVGNGNELVIYSQESYNGIGNPFLSTGSATTFTSIDSAIKALASPNTKKVQFLVNVGRSSTSGFRALELSTNGGAESNYFFYGYASSVTDVDIAPAWFPYDPNMDWEYKVLTGSQVSLAYLGEEMHR